jgi:hypothetical protein
MTAILTIEGNNPSLAIRRSKNDDSVAKIIMYKNNVKHEAVLTQRHSNFITRKLQESSIINPKREILYSFCQKIFS